jgi:hypothetical protein
MKQLTAEQIDLNWKALIDLIEDTFEGERKENLLKMYNHFQERMMMAPASGQEHFHNCHPGGYVEHILNIVKYSKQFYKLWKDNGAYVDNYTEEELIFAALHHDLGKAGDLEQDHYIPNPSDWHRKNQGKIYTNNPEMNFMTPPDRGIWILNQFGVKLTQNEFIGIKLTDGMYDEGNIQYLKSYAPEKKLKSNIAHILHQADMTTTRIEYEQWIHSTDEEKATTTKVPKTKKEQETVDNMKAKFDELFTI